MEIFNLKKGTYISWYLESILASLLLLFSLTYLNEMIDSNIYKKNE